MGKNSRIKTTRAKKLLAIIVSGVIAIALGLTCGIFFGTGGSIASTDGVGSGSVSNSVTQPTANNATVNDYTAPGALKNGDVLNFSYVNKWRTWSSNKYYTVRLPKGKYKFEVWGARGGSGADNSVYGNFAAYGKGGYSYGTIEISETTTFYIYNGGMGEGNPNNWQQYAPYATVYGGYNGGGDTCRDSYEFGGSGGGATHIATRNGLLRDLVSYKSEVILVAGAGGGTGEDNERGGDGGGTSSVNAYHSSFVATQTAAGVNSNDSSKNGGFGYGATYNNSGESGGGGGGGWYGGGGGAGGGSGGGSGYINTSKLTDARTIAGNTSFPAPGGGNETGHNGAGYSRITAIQVNQAPVTKSTEPFALGARGTTGKNIAVQASAIADDVDCVNYGGTRTNVYFTDGNANAANKLDTITKNDNNIRLENGASAKNYLDWSIDANRITITGVKRYPRKGVDGSTQPDGTLKLTTKVRDAFGTNTTRGYGDVTFTVTVTEQTPTKIDGIEINTADDETNIYNNAYLGTSKNTTPELATEVNVYHPNGAGKYTLMLAHPLRLRNNDGSNENDVKVTFNIADIFKNLSNVTTISPYDDVYCSINDTSKIRPTDSARMFKVSEFDAGASSSALKTPTGTTIQNAYKTITLVGLKADPDYQVMSTKIYVVERATSVQVPFANEFDLDIVFKIDNTRPTLKAGKLPVVTLNDAGVLQTTTIFLNDYFKDIDGNEINGKTHRITDVKIPKSEFVQLDKYGKVLSAVDGKTSYFNLINAGEYGYPSQAALNRVMTDGELDKTGTTYPTGFKDWYISTGATNTDTEYAYVQYSFNNDSLTLYGRRATHSMYSDTRITDSSAIISGSTENADGIGAGNCTAGIGGNAGDFYILIHIQDFNDTDDEGIWLPLGITVYNSRPTEMNTEGDSVGASYMPTISGEIGKTTYFSPMGITVDDYINPKSLGFRLDGTTPVYDLVPLASDPDNYFVSSMVGFDGDINDLLTVSSTAASVRGSVPNNIGSDSSRGEYFDVEPFEVYIGAIDSPMFSGRVPTTFKANSGFTTKEITVNIDGSNVTKTYVVVNGLKITLKNRTHDRYLYATAEVRDTSGATQNVRIAIKAENTTPEMLENTKVAQIDYKYNGKTISSEYSKATSTITYNIPRGSSVIVTPYDILTDADMTASGAAYPEKGFTLNGFNGAYVRNSGTLTDNKGVAGTYTISGIADSSNLESKGGNAGGYDYSSTAYMGGTGALVTSLKSIGAQRNGGMRTFTNCVSATNTYAPGTSGQTGTDRLFFARTGDADNLDGFDFNPYAANATGYGTLAAPVTENESFILIDSGSTVEIGGGTYDLDFFVITAMSKTPSGIKPKLTFTVRDRTGAGSAGEHLGVRQINVIINIVNSTPYLSDDTHPDFVYTLATSAVSDSSIAYPTLELMATSILADNEGEDVAFFLSGSTDVSVLDGNGEAQDKYRNPYRGAYINVSLTAEKMTITALNSTQNITSGLFITFYATDYRSNNPDEQSRLTIQIQVLNSAPTENRGENGLDFVNLFDPTRPEAVVGSWTVESFSEADKTTPRFFASGAKAAEYVRANEYDALGHIGDGQVKVIVSDTDALQGAVLAPIHASRGATQYIGIPAGTNKSDYKNYVPYIATGDATANNPVAVKIGFVNAEGATDAASASLMNERVGSYGIIYFVENGAVGGNPVIDAYTADELRSADNDIIEKNSEKFFDSEGRWIVKDWAIYVKPQKEFLAGKYLKLAVSLRDDSEFGGDTFGKPTALFGDASNVKVDDETGTVTGLTTVSGLSAINCYMFVKGTGLRTLDYYDKFNGYYTVTDGNDSSVSYVSTYDGSAISKLEKPVNVYWDGGSDTAQGTISDSTGTPVKVLTAGENDKTFAGVHSGTPYNEFDADALQSGEKAFRYSHTVQIDGSAAIPTYIPMSYFALKETPVSPETGDRIVDGKPVPKGTVYYDPTSYISFNVKGASNEYPKYDRNRVQSVASAITISDGKTRYTGTTSVGGSQPLASNPYINVALFDLDAGSTSSSYYLNSPYLNNCLAVTTVEGGEARDYVRNSQNYDNFVGNGHLMYLAQQSELQEHRFGLILTKKDTRSSVSNLTITVDVATCSDVGEGTQVNCPIDSSTGKPDTERYTASVTLKLEIGNSPLTLETPNPQEENYYAIDMMFNTAGGAQDIGLVRDAKSDEAGKFSTAIVYSDSDAADSAYFYSDSLYKFSSWTDAADGSHLYERTYAKSGSGANTLFKNTDSDERAQGSMARYFGKSDAQSVAADSTFTPNDGKYGAGNSEYEGFSKYFSAIVSDGGKRLSITPHARTVINPEAVIDDSGNIITSKDAITKFYETRGLVAVFDETTNKVVSAYYPLRVLVYDSCGDGFGVASYVGLEIRIYIADTAPVLSESLESTGTSKVDKTLNYSLAVDSSYTFSLNDVFTDPDMLTGGKGWFYKSDFDKLAETVKTDIQNGREYTDSRFGFETGNYLLSPFGKDWTNPDNSQLHTENPVIKNLYDIKTQPDGINNPTDAQIRANQPDVIMYMEYDGDSVVGGTTCPSNNTVTIRVNRRTMYEDKNGNYKQQSKFKFVMTFTDSYCTYTKDFTGKVIAEYKNVTGQLTVNVTVTNKAPYQFDTQTYRPVSSVKMRVGDSFTLLTTPSDYFDGSAIYSEVSAKSSVSYGNYVSAKENAVIHTNLMQDENGKRPGGAAVSTYKYNELTCANLNTDKYRLRDATKDDKKNIHLGYSAIATDDAPWTLRMSVKCDESLFNALQRDVVMSNETVYDKNGNVIESSPAPIDYVITALSSCVNHPITVTVKDAEGATYEHIIYVTVESTPPRPLTEGDTSTSHTLNAGLSYTDKDGMFDLYMRASGGGAAVTRNVMLNTGKAVDVYSAINVDVKGVAYDPDSMDDSHIALYVGNSDLDIFTVNDKELSYENGVYYNDKFEIRVTDSDYSSFSIKCKAYDRATNEDYLKFYVRDVGNNVFANAAEVTIRITTLYSSLYNRHNVEKTILEANQTYTITDADTVKVKGYDVYNGVGISLDDPRRGEQSTYRVLDYAKAADSVDNVGNDKYIKDPDVAVDNNPDSENPDAPIDFGVLNYDVRVYAFLDETAAFGAMPLDAVSAYFDIRRDDKVDYNNYFRLKQDAASLREIRSKYLIGGRTANGNTFRNEINKKLLAFVNNYFEFTMGDDGVSLMFRPISANIDNDILLYVEVEKISGTVAVTPDTQSTSLVAGSLFYVKVDDSAPIANNDMSFTGRAVKSVISADGSSETIPSVEGVNTASFRIFGGDSTTAMFTDSDKGDEVTVDEFKREIAYQKAFGDMYEYCKGGTNTSRAIDIAVDGNILTVKINRRIDYDGDGDGKVDNEVTVPVRIEGKDRVGSISTAIVSVTVVNNDVTIDLDALEEKGLASQEFSKHTGYSLTAGDAANEFVLRIKATVDDGEYDSHGVYRPSRRTFDVVKWLYDEDFTNAIKDTDSYRIVADPDENQLKYLVDGPLDVVDSNDGSNIIATLHPVFEPDKAHFTGFTLTAKSYDRGHTGVAYLRIFDKSGDETDPNAGVKIRIIIEIGNTAPKIKDNMSSTVNPTIFGSDTKMPATMRFNIADYVEDKNSTDGADMVGKTETYIRVDSVFAEMPEEIYSTATDGNGDNILTTEIDPDNPLVFTVRPIMGFYGKQKVSVTVSDGMYSDNDTESVTFTIAFEVIYDFAEISKLKEIDATRGMPVSVSADTLIEPLENTASGGASDGNKDDVVKASADDAKETFNPGKNYVVTKLTVPNSYASFVAIQAPTESSPEWKFVPKKVTTVGQSISLNVEFKLASDVDNENAKTYSKSFSVSIAENPAPKLLADFKSGKTFYTGNGATRYDLDAEGVVFLAPADIFTDNTGDVMTFISASSKSPTQVDVKVASADSLRIKFNCSGESEITVTVADTTGETHAHPFTISNHDRAEPDFWQSVMISFELNKWIWITVIIAVVLAIIILIIVIIAVKRRKRKREELEAMLISEMELEEQMLRLSAAPGMTQYNSYGYLPPTAPMVNDPGLMLGSGNAVNNPNVLNLNPGQVPTPPTVDISNSANQDAGQSYSPGYGPGNGIDDM